MTLTNFIFRTIDDRPASLSDGVVAKLDTCLSVVFSPRREGRTSRYWRILNAGFGTRKHQTQYTPSRTDN